MSDYFIAPGITHNCSPSTAVLNMIFLAISLGSLQAEQVAAGLLKNKMDKDNIQKGEVFLLSTGGKKLQVQVGCSDNKSKRKSVIRFLFSWSRNFKLSWNSL